VLCAVLPLLQSVLSVEARQPLSATSAWVDTCSSNTHISKVLGERGGVEDPGGGAQGSECRGGG